MAIVPLNSYSSEEATSANNSERLVPPNYLYFFLTEYQVKEGI